TLVPRTRLISQVMEEFNAVEIEGDLTGAQLYQGRGAGRKPTASAVVSDIVQALRGEPMLRTHPGAGRQGRIRPMAEGVSPHYFHLEVIDRPGVIATLSRALAQHAISIASMFQPNVDHGSQVPLVLTTHPAPEAHMRAALEEIGKEPFLKGKPVHIRMEAP